MCRCCPARARCVRTRWVVRELPHSMLLAQATASLPQASAPPLQPLFADGLVRAVTEGMGWRAWRPTDPPIPSVHPHGERCADEANGDPGNNELYWPLGNRRLVHQKMCLPRNDHISDRIRRQGRWTDCSKFVQFWRTLDGQRTTWRTNGVRHVRSEIDYLASNDSHGRGSLVEIGANIGSCTVELLLRTRARIVAFEPSPSNLFYLTRSLRLAAQRDPSVAERVVVFPVAAGDAPSRLRAYAQRGNLGNTVIGLPITDACGGTGTKGKCARKEMFELPPVDVQPLDNIFPEGIGDVRVMKLDTQGFECRVLEGAKRVMSSSSRLEVVAVEVADRWLYKQCCRPVWLLHLLQVSMNWTVSCSGGAARLSEYNCFGRRSVPAQDVGKRMRGLRGNRYSANEKVQTVMTGRKLEDKRLKVVRCLKYRARNELVERDHHKQRQEAVASLASRASNSSRL